MIRPKALLVAQEPKSLGPKAKVSGLQGRRRTRGEPARNVVGDFGILKEIDDDAEQAEDAAGGDESAGVEGAGAGFAFVFLLVVASTSRRISPPANIAAVVPSGKIGAGGKSERADAEDFDGDDERDAHQYQAPRKALIEDAADYGGHQARLRRGSFVAADALRPLIFDFLEVGVVEIFAVGISCEPSELRARSFCP